MGATTPAPKSRRRSPAQPRRAATPAAPRPQIARETTPSLERTGHPLAVTLSGHTERAWLYRTPPGPGPQVFFIEHPDFFDRAGIYGDNNGDYPDNDRRFAFFCLAALTALPEIAPETLVALGLPVELYHPDVFEWYGRMNALKGGMAHSDVVVTVSPSHAEELRTAEGGF